MSSLSLDRDEYINLLTRMISHTEKLQNKPPQHVPTESLIADIVQEILEPYRHHISIEKIEYVKNRPNLIIKYWNPLNSNLRSDESVKTLGFIGSHMDVVPADPDEWTINPFTLTVDTENPDILWGRGTTDCLGHVALLTLLLKNLSESNVRINYLLSVVFISDEECGADPTIGISQVSKDGHLDFLKNGPVFWVDSSDVYPTVGSGTGIAWQLKTFGKRGHSGMPFNTINPIIGAYQATNSLLIKFKECFPQHENDVKYKYKTSSNMKPTQLFETEGSINQIPESVTIRGDIRLTPFYDSSEVKRVLSEHVEYLNNHLEELPQLHESFPTSLDSEDCKLRFELEWIGDPYEGVACDMESIGFKLISKATEKIMGTMDIISSTGSLPLIADLKKAGLDMQIIGYGNGDSYHANNEYCTYSGMNKGYCIILDVIMNYY